MTELVERDLSFPHECELSGYQKRLQRTRETHREQFPRVQHPVDDGDIPEDLSGDRTCVSMMR